MNRREEESEKNQYYLCWNFRLFVDGEEKTNARFSSNETIIEKKIVVLCFILKKTSI
jgi:hypothetical protein